MKNRLMARGAVRFALAGLVLLSAGCTTYVDTQVTAFSDWRGSDATRTYAFTRTSAQQNSLEEATYERIVGDELALYDFRRVSASGAHYLVGLTYGIKSSLVAVQQPVYYDPWFAGPGPFWGGGPFGPWGPWGPPYPAGYVNQTYRVFERALEIRITERATGKEVYNVSARNAGDSGSLLQAMPYLARAALADFPLGNGTVRTVRLPVSKTGGAAPPPAGNERAVPGAAAGASAVSGTAPAPAK